ncbi:hypothetical protein P3T76_014728 [Phytophthora citrophthora]|uniref:Uncharacterized protein n=1 Tax=Phytophthora citrophthora TaxID=4793 RepID=A0AAD9FY70_9STRA|nr:hypothetical protein P3T76_016167 [Phytophthora citrophthora]KAK1928971.1 hypothetical protein P3T76_015611 [Phytophthora citrophthora]KAK1929879.1 hypothetical protein P3T76_014725 [Phytophthora citrophthora]KAK1929882.1 hypothetical protein P3T76_014728 [Phytophthora citrophthora]
MRKSLSASANVFRAKLGDFSVGVAGGEEALANMDQGDGEEARRVRVRMGEGDDGEEACGRGHGGDGR